VARAGHAGFVMPALWGRDVNEFPLDTVSVEIVVEIVLKAAGPRHPASQRER